MKYSNFNKFPFIEAGKKYKAITGWKRITDEIGQRICSIKKEKIILAVECYHGVYEEELSGELNEDIQLEKSIITRQLFKTPSEISSMVSGFLTDDPVFGVLSNLNIADYFDELKLNQAKEEIGNCKKGIILICGTGASLIAEYDILIYADMARWEIQQRFRRNEISNLGVDNKDASPALNYKHAFFIDWRACDRLKTGLFDKWDYFLDTNDPAIPKMTTGDAIRDVMNQAVNQPFELTPYFDPGPWGGQWMKEVCGLSSAPPNYAWCFNCVPEENSLLVKIEEIIFEMPSINLVLYKPLQLLGKKVYNTFGAEFPIRFDFLDTIHGGNLSLQVHPLTEYIKEKFGWPYTQDESYYLMDAQSDAKVYLGLKENISKIDFEDDLYKADREEITFPDDKYIETWPVKKHDHILIPGGTVHCSGKGCMVLEISSTPYIFTFKLWDWGRMGLNGEPRPTHIEHGMNVIQFNRTTKWTKKNLINRIETIAVGDGWREERTGLHELEFIETRRHWFVKAIEIKTDDGVNVLNLVEGDEIIVESPSGSFTPLVVHYAETFIIPAAVDKVILRPSEKSRYTEFIVMRAYIR